MEKDASLLELVRTKELELKEEESRAKVNAEGMLSDARATAEGLKRSAEAKGEGLARAYYSREMARLASEQESIRKNSAAKRQEVRSRGLSGLDAAVQRVMERVAFP